MYVRDARSPRPASGATSRVMSANRAKHTGPELRLRKALWAAGARGYRLHARGLPGRPDLAFAKRRVAVFVNGCYWHHCPVCAFPIPKHNRAFWIEKFARNHARDAKKIVGLRAAGWVPIVVWEHEIREDLAKVVSRILRRVRP